MARTGHLFCRAGKLHGKQQRCHLLSLDVKEVIFEGGVLFYGRACEVIL